MSDVDSEWRRKLEWQRKGATLSEKPQRRNSV